MMKRMNEKQQFSVHHQQSSAVSKRRNENCDCCFHEFALILCRCPDGNLDAVWFAFASIFAQQNGCWWEHFMCTFQFYFIFFCLLALSHSVTLIWPLIFHETLLTGSVFLFERLFFIDKNSMLSTNFVLLLVDFIFIWMWWRRRRRLIATKRVLSIYAWRMEKRIGRSEKKNCRKKDRQPRKSVKRNNIRIELDAGETQTNNLQSSYTTLRKSQKKNRNRQKDPVRPQNQPLKRLFLSEWSTVYLVFICLFSWNPPIFWLI